jgi:hypothetical protein
MRTIARRLTPWVWGVGVIVAIAVPALTLPRLPAANLWPLLIGLGPWVVGKYLLCPLRWHALTQAGLSRWWHTRAYAESELLGLLTPGHGGADIWRVRRLTRAELSAPDAVASVGLDRLVGAVGLTMFVAVAGAALPTQMLLLVCGLAAAALIVALVVRRLRPDLMPTRPRPPVRVLVRGLALSVAYQLSIAGLLYASVDATGHQLAPLALIGAFGASQIAGAVPGPAGASPRDGALVVALASLGLPWTAAAVAVALTAAIAWLPALMLGGSSLLLTRRSALAAAA